MNRNEQFLSLIGLCLRGRNLEVGEEPVEAVARARDARVLLLASDAADNTARRVTVDGKEVELAYKEYELLLFFIENPNKVLSREELMNRVWNTDFSGESRTLDIHIRTLRQKLGAAGDYIRTVRKVGYQLAFDETAEA